MNKVLLVGRLVRDAELISNANGEKQGLRFVIAVDRNFRNTKGEKEADFISVNYWSNFAEKMINFLPKGKLISITGRISVRTIINDDGTKKYFTNVIAEDIQFLDSRRKEEVV